MATTLSKPDLLLQSADNTWDRARWEALGEDGNRYEVIDGVLYMSTAPRPLHQLVSRLTERALYEQIDDLGLGVTLHAPSASSCRGAILYSPIFSSSSPQTSISSNRPGSRAFPHSS